VCAQLSWVCAFVVRYSNTNLSEFINIDQKFCLRDVAPVIFDDYTEEGLSDGTKDVSTQYRKV